MAVTIEFGYRDADGTSGSSRVSPADRPIEEQARIACDQAALSEHDWLTWVSGEPVDLVALVAERLGLPIGRRDPQGKLLTEAGETPDHDHEFVFDAKQTFRFFGSPKQRRGKVYSCTVGGCDSVQVRGR